MCLWTLQWWRQTAGVKNTLWWLLCFQLQTERAGFALLVSRVWKVWNKPLTTTPLGSAFEEGLRPLPSPSNTQHPVFLGGQCKRFLPNQWVTKQLLPCVPVIPLAGWTLISQLCSTHTEPQNDRKGWVWWNLKNHPVATHAQGRHPLDQVAQVPIQPIHHPLLKNFKNCEL